MNALGCDGGLSVTLDRVRTRTVVVVVVKSDSRYLTDGMTRWIRTWRRETTRAQGRTFYHGREEGGERVVNSRIFRDVDELVTQVERLGTDVLFWWVSREQNREADRLAKRALLVGSGDVAEEVNLVDASGLLALG